jgi:serine/threonine-protein kinase HipA
MRRAKIILHGIPAGILEERAMGRQYAFRYFEDYSGPPISLTLCLRKEEYGFDSFPPFFDGLLPEGVQLEALLRQSKIDRRDLFSQLVAVGNDLVGATTVQETE